MNTSESALESWECILFIPKIFEVVEYSIEDPQIKMCGIAILANLGENTKCKADQRGRWVIADIFCWKILMMILLENLLDGTQSGTQFWNLGFKNQKNDFFDPKKTSNLKYM